MSAPYIGCAIPHLELELLQLNEHSSELISEVSPPHGAHGALIISELAPLLFKGLGDVELDLFLELLA